MFENLDVFRLSATMAAHAGARQAVTAANVANADTPGYRAQVMDDFAASYGDGLSLRTSRPGHLAGEVGGAITRVTDAGGEAAPNGNTVSLETEMLASVDAAREHARALAIYRHGLTVLRTALGR